MKESRKKNNLEFQVETSFILPTNTSIVVDDAEFDFEEGKSTAGF